MIRAYSKKQQVGTKKRSARRRKHDDDARRRQGTCERCDERPVAEMHHRLGRVGPAAVVNDPRALAYLCKPCHDIMGGLVKSVPVAERIMPDGLDDHVLTKIVRARPDIKRYEDLIRAYKK